MAEYYTLKWFDLEDTEGGGSGGGVSPVATLTVKNDSRSDGAFPCENLLAETVFVENNHMVQEPSYSTRLSPGEETTIQVIVPYIEAQEPFTFDFWVQLGPENGFYTAPTNLVNCHVEELQYEGITYAFLVVDDPSKPLSCNMTTYVGR